MKIESDRMAGLSVEQRERLLDVLTSLGERMIDTIHRGDSRLFSVAICDGQFTSCIGLDWESDPQQYEAVTEWSTEYLRQMEDRYGNGHDQYG
ncbi:hypothetical protein Pla110_24340 [Polystyrenella longa]|uniref:Uncharacterized protein n=1 Tax=Polystyrenella longa TaxID=2528007 RepID=A0A518CN93_9PLAN|nr:hypothetical protein [Polystyrenella longa]QDU80702.1 hypothetical protein Pla110_24340 [Polystyrenella longa]